MSTIPGFTNITELQLADLLYVIRGLGADQDKNIKIEDFFKAISNELPLTYDLTSANATKTLPEITGLPQRVSWYWENGDGTYKVTPAVTDGATIGGIAAALWLGEGEGRVVIESDGTNWQVREYAM